MKNNWQTKKLGEICKTSSGGTPSRKNKIFYDGEIPWVKSGELNFNTIRDTDEKISDEAIKQSSAKLFPKGTLLIALYGATVGKLAFLGLDAATNQAVCAIMPKNGLANKYLYWYLFSKRKDLVGKSIGGAQPNISQTILKEVEIPVPPLPTQHRIVEKIEELFSELDNGVENLKKAQKQLKTYRQAVLKDAFEGKLTKEWRAQKDDLPTPEELLQQIKSERKAHRQRELAEWEQEVEQWEKDGKPGRKPRKPRKLDQYDQLTEKQIDNLKVIPKDWLWMKVGNICPSIVPNRDKPKSFSGNIPWLTTPDIDLKKISIDLTKLDQGLTPDEVEKYNARLIPSDSVIMTCVGSFGVICVNRISCVCNQQLHAFITENLINPSYLAYALKEKKSWMEKEATSTTVSYLNKTKANSIPVPLCSEQEQKEIVNEIESRLSVVDQLEQTIKENLQKAEALRQSILKKAFGGELVL